MYLHCILTKVFKIQLDLFTMVTCKEVALAKRCTPLEGGLKIIIQCNFILWIDAQSGRKILAIIDGGCS